MPSNVRKTLRHAFKVTYTLPNGEEGIQKQFAKVKTPSRAVVLTLTEADVQHSIDSLRGQGNTMMCSMAMCANRLASQFPHKVIGFIDWQYKTAFVVSKLDRNGMPAECYRYLHNSTVAHLNDTLRGQQHLLRMVRDAGGEITITLRPRIRNDRTQTGGTGRQDDSRSTVVHRTRGAEARRNATRLALGLSI